MSERYTKGRFARRAKSLGSVDYKDTGLLMNFIGERGKILSRTVTGLSARDQRRVTKAIKQARHISLLPFVSAGGMRGESRRDDDSNMMDVDLMADDI